MGELRAAVQGPRTGEPHGTEPEPLPWRPVHIFQPPPDAAGKGFITVEPGDTQQWSITFTPKLPAELTQGRTPYGRRLQIAYAESLDRALNSADAYATRQVGREMSRQ